MKDDLVKVYIGVAEGNDERDFYHLTENVRNRRNEVGSLDDPELDLSRNDQAWFLETYKIPDMFSFYGDVCQEKLFLHRIACAYLSKFTPYIPSEVAFQLRFPKDQQPMRCCRPGMMLTLDCGVRVYCDWLIDNYGFPVQNWGPKAIFLIPGTFGRGPLNSKYRVVSKLDRTLEMFNGSHNQCVDWISHRIASSVENYEVTEVK